MQMVQDDGGMTEVAEGAESPGPGPKRRPRARDNPGVRQSLRLTREVLLERATFLAEPGRTMIHAHFALGMSPAEIAQLQRCTESRIRRRIKRLREALSDPCFALAARFGSQLPAELGHLARDYWIGGMALRLLAANRGQTLHRVRQDITVARSLLVVAMARDQEVPPELARRAIDGRRS